MFNILVALMLSSGDVEARRNRGNRQHPHRHKNYWVYPHHRSGFIWKWLPGHFNPHGRWVHGRWAVVVRF